MLKIRFLIASMGVVMLFGMIGVSFAQNDTDGDGFNDNVDSCPNVPGTIQGCPDSDGDGRPDVIDDCPNVPGTAQGCPDADGDGFRDGADECPNVPGTIRGCPDADGDGFPDVIDDCPNVAGTIRGCVDTDGDGRPDVVDDCPNVAGTIRGCPPPPTPTPMPQPTNTDNSQPTPTEVATDEPGTISPANLACELIPNPEAGIVIYRQPSLEAEVVGVLDPQTDYVVYGIKAPDNWYWLDIGWVLGESVSITGNCGSLSGFDMPVLDETTQTTINLTEIDFTRAQVSCTYLLALADTFCFYQLPIPNDDSTMICIMQSNVLNCDIGTGLLFALLNHVFGGETTPVTELPDLTANIGNGGVRQIAPDDAYLNCADLMLEFLSPYFVDNENLVFRLVDNYLVGFLPRDAFVAIAPRPCRTDIRYVTPLVENNEIMTDFAVQPLIMQYESWTPIGNDDLAIYEGDVPLVALLLPDFQKSLTKRGELAGVPIRIDFVNRFILFGDGSVFFGFNTTLFSQQVQMLTEIDFSQ